MGGPSHWYWLAPYHNRRENQKGEKKKMKEEVHGEERTEYSRQKGEDKLQVQKDQDKKIIHQPMN